MRLLLALCLLLGAGLVQAFDHSHSAWNSLLQRHVLLISEGKASQVNYAGMLQDRAELQAYLDALSEVDSGEYQTWSLDQQLAFLINAYNAFTVELVLTDYPGIESIKDLGSLFRSPWKQRFFTLLGEGRHLDNLEHDLIRAPGVFDEPRIHFAVNCASIGCPMLREEAYVAERLDYQLEESTRHFITDRSRNRFDSASSKLQVSKIFDWYREDFKGAASGGDDLKAYFSAQADLLGDSEQARGRLRSGDFRIEFLDYDWSLNAQVQESLELTR
jgi:hypothetical protein